MLIGTAFPTVDTIPRSSHPGQDIHRNNITDLPQNSPNKKLSIALAASVLLAAVDSEVAAQDSNFCPKAEKIGKNCLPIVISTHLPSTLSSTSVCDSISSRYLFIASNIPTAAPWFASPCLQPSKAACTTHTHAPKLFSIQPLPVLKVPI
jgi:hypothetical protein